MAPFLRNQWYTAATSVELGEKPLARRTTHYFPSTVRSWGLDDANVSKSTRT
jgi:hypothetical protein